MTFIDMNKCELPEQEPPLCKEGAPRVASADWLKWYMKTNAVGVADAHKEFRNRLSKMGGGLCL